jgi:hypothetical protein
MCRIQTGLCRSTYEEETALTLGKAVAGLNAQSKERRLGIYEKKKEKYEKVRPQTPEGKKGWGAKGELDLDYIGSLAK